MSGHLARFTAIGEELEAQWRETGYLPDALPALAEQAVAAIEVPDVVDLLEQHYDRFDHNHVFSAFDLHIWANERLRIELLHWLSVSTSIHQHVFCGAFRVLRGRSLNIESTFTPRRRISEDLVVGRLDLRHSRVMRTGDTHRIEYGDRFIHANFHLGRPTMTAVVRTIQMQDANPQLTYLPPHFAIDPFTGHRSVKGRHAALDFLARLDRPADVEALAGRMLAEATLGEAIDIVMHPTVLHAEEQVAGRLLAMACDRHSDFAAEIHATAEEERRRHRAVLLRRKVRDFDQKFLVALVANLSDRATILGHLAECFPGETSAASAARLLHGVAEAGQLSAFAADDIPILADMLAGRRAADRAGPLGELLRHELVTALLPPEGYAAALLAA